MAKVELKQPVVEEISAGIKDAQSIVLVDYRGLTVEQDTQLRKSLREAGVSYKVYKNTMMNFRVQGYTVRRSVRVSGRTQRNGLLYRGCNRSCKSTGSVR